MYVLLLISVVTGLGGANLSRIASVRVARQEVCDMRRDVTIGRMWMVRPSQTRSRHCGTLVRPYTKVTKERCTAPDWTTEQGKAFAPGSERITRQNPDVHHDATHRASNASRNLFNTLQRPMQRQLQRSVTQCQQCVYSSGSRSLTNHRADACNQLGLSWWCSSRRRKEGLGFNYW